jgi:SAM-dependent methyltransferase|tara:strand:- start:40 stop:861 length:822 start_codon:yes stop_codon:yes gene_type:complete
MLSIEEIKLLIEKLEKAKATDFKELIDTNLKILKDIEMAVDANNQEEINRLDKTEEWFARDNERKRLKPIVDAMLFRLIQTKIFQFSREANQIEGSNINYNSMEIGPGTGMFSKEFRSWRLNYFVDVLPDVQNKIRRRFPPAAQKNIKFFSARGTACEDIPQGSCNFIFSWDTFVFFTQKHIKQYFKDIKRVLIPGGYCLIQYADCHYDLDLQEAKRGYWNYNTKTIMTQIIEEEGFEVIEMNQFRAGANYAVFRKPGKQNPTVYDINQIKID